MGLGNILLPTCRRRWPSDLRPLPSRDTGLNHQHSSRWALGTSYCRHVADIRPRIHAPTRPRSPTPRDDTGSSTDNASAGPWELHASPCCRLTQLPLISSEPRTQRSHLCRSPCSQLASPPHDHHRRRPCSQLARDRTTAHPAPTLRKPLLPTSKLATHWLIQHPQVSITLSYVHTYPNACSWRVQWRLHEDAN
jgi:hypothetical protein